MAVKKVSSTVFCLGAFLIAAFSQPLGNGAISGSVVDGEGGDPIRKAIVTLTQEGTPRRWATARTDGSGQFQFDGLPAGKYDLRATKGNEGTAIYGANHLGELGDSITLADGEIRGGVSLRLLRAASISGRVYDSDGDPVPDSTVNLLRPGRNLGAPVLVNYRGASTDDHGEYRFANIDPGRYYLRVTPSSARLGGMPAGQQPMLMAQYYGGARDSKEAAPVHVGGGESLAGFDFHVTSEPAVEIRGRVLGVPENLEPPQEATGGAASSGVFISSGAGVGFHKGMNQQGVEVRISPAEAASQGWSGTVTQGDDHRFEMADMPAGRYRIEAVLHSGSKAYGASQILDLRSNSGDIVLTLAPAVDIQGTLRVDGPAPRVEERAARVEGPAVVRQGGNGLRVQLERPGVRQGNISAEVGPDGHFTLPQVLPGEWQLNVTPVPPGFLKTAKFGDKDIRFTAFEVGSKENTLSIVVSLHTGTVEGEVDAASPDAKRAGIVLAPVGEYHTLTRFYYGGSANNDGKFHISGIAPGKYKIFAIEKMTASRFRNPEAVDQLDELGQVIEVAEGAKAEAHPKLIPAPRAEQALQ